MSSGVRSVALVAFLVGLGTEAQAQSGRAPADSARAAAFDRLDRTAQALIWTVQCAQRSSYARSTGRFGPSDSLGRRGLCLRRGGRVLGVAFTPDSTFSYATLVRVVDLTSGARYAGPVDTAAILNEARASTDALLRGYEPFEKAGRQFAPLSFRSDGDSIEVWLLPAQLFMGQMPSAVGGERGFVFAPDGRTVARQVDAFSQHRALTIPSAGTVELLSSEDEFPLVSELIVANLLHRRGRDVQIITKAFASRLVGSQASPIWVHLKR